MNRAFKILILLIPTLVIIGFIFYCYNASKNNKQIDVSSKLEKLSINTAFNFGELNDNVFDSLYILPSYDDLSNTRIEMDSKDKDVIGSVNSVTETMQTIIFTNKNIIVNYAFVPSKIVYLRDFEMQMLPKNSRFKIILNDYGGKELVSE